MQKSEIFEQKQNSLQISIWFLKNYFTNTCLGYPTDKVTTGFEKDVFTGMI